jgi:hypothetical protein
MAPFVFLGGRCLLLPVAKGRQRGTRGCSELAFVEQLPERERRERTGTVGDLVSIVCEATGLWHTCHATPAVKKKKIGWILSPWRH